ncbi:MAG: hypothetical protein ACI845_000956 [Gammaproteobacteria bacterium]|jgi:hypothetical protein
MAVAANPRWRDKAQVIAFAPDNGVHIAPSAGKCNHGLDGLEDMDIFLCYGIYTRAIKN